MRLEYPTTYPAPSYIDHPCKTCVSLGRTRAPFPKWYVNYCSVCASCGRTEHEIEARDHHPDCSWLRARRGVLMTLAELIQALEAEVAQNPDKILKLGFARPHSYRGDYSSLAFQPAERVSVADILADARLALGKTYTGYKGDEYKMHDYTHTYLAKYGECGESIGPTLLKLMLANEVTAEELELEAKRERIREMASEAIKNRVSWLQCLHDELVDKLEQESIRKDDLAIRSDSTYFLDQILLESCGG